MSACPQQRPKPTAGPVRKAKPMQTDNAEPWGALSGLLVQHGVVAGFAVWLGTLYHHALATALTGPVVCAGTYLVGGCLVDWLLGTVEALSRPKDAPTKRTRFNWQIAYRKPARKWSAYMGYCMATSMLAQLVGQGQNAAVIVMSLLTVREILSILGHCNALTDGSLGRQWGLGIVVRFADSLREKWVETLAESVRKTGEVKP